MKKSSPLVKGSKLSSKLNFTIKWLHNLYRLAQSSCGTLFTGGLALTITKLLTIALAMLAAYLVGAFK